jgi:hypothetical protein
LSYNPDQPASNDSQADVNSQPPTFKFKPDFTQTSYKLAIGEAINR